MPAPYAPKPPCIFTEADRYYAAAALIVGFIIVKTFVRSADGTGYGLMSSVSALLATVFNYLYCRRLGMKGGKTTSVLFVTSLALSCVFTVCDNVPVVLLSIAMIFLSNLYFSYASFREGRRSVVNNLFRAVFISPFYEFGALCPALFHKSEDKTSKKSDLKKTAPIVAGVVLSVPLCIVVVILLGSADKAFGSIFSISLDSFSKWIEDHLLSDILILAVSVPLSMYIFGAVYSRAYKMRNDALLVKTAETKVRLLPSSLCAAFLTPLTLIYVIFTLMQLFHFFTANVMSDPGFTYAEYARSGFFQLCAVALINLSVISGVTFFTKNAEKRLPRVLSAFVTVFCVLTECLIVTALSKMLLYISIYGMTPKRVETSVFMIYLFVMFVVLIVKQCGRKLSFTKIGYCLAAAVLLLMAFIPVDALIARYNISKYESGEISWMGYKAMKDLDAGAASVFAEKYEKDGDSDTTFSRSYASYKSYYGDNFDEMTFWDLNIPRYIAGRVIKDERPSEKDPYESWNTGEADSLDIG